jgi:hypothetical protein
MAEWVLVPCLAQLRAEFNLIAPGRDKKSDGSIGDVAHQSSSSDHNADETGNVPIHDADSMNEVHAIDVDKDLRAPDLTMEQVVQFLLSRCRTGQERRLRYVIYNRRIWSASSDWVQKAYTGSNAHAEHAHFSASYETSREASTASWHLEDLVALTDADKDWFRALFERTAQPDNGGVTSKIGRDALDQGIPNPIAGKKTPAYQVMGDIAQGVKDIKVLLGTADVDEVDIAARVLAGLTPERLGAAMVAAGLTPAAIADAVPTEVARDVADFLAARLAD